ncbi:MAG: hypothetical protein ACRCYY_09780 [Trueperaceae bacterium]
MSDESRQTFSAREIVLELFPATPDALVPKSAAYQMQPNENGSIHILTAQGQTLLTLEAMTTTGNAATQLCCDFCKRNAPRSHFVMLRVEVPNTDGRRFFYMSRCKDHEGCESRRFNDKPIRELLARVFDEA